MRDTPLPPECDVVMKGGITSGVVYPAAIVALSHTFRFRNIGGTSAGAIAAAVTAAAEYGRQTGRGASFCGLAELPAWLGSKNHLRNLFRPNRATRGPFNVLMRVLAAPKNESKARAGAAALAASYPAAASCGLLGGLVPVAGGALVHAWWLLTIGVLLAASLPLAIPAYLLVRAMANDVPENFYGLCSGISDADADDPTVLTSWLAKLIDDLAGVSGGDKPLTFGDLWSAGEAQVSPGAAPVEEQDKTAASATSERDARSINLEMITTNITHGRPYKYPFDTHVFYFDPHEFAKLFPPRIVTWMERNARRPRNDEEAARMRSALPRMPLPEAQDIPIVVAARMSLSFPLLISAVPLWSVDWTLRANKSNREAPHFERCWFSDGGLSSNFPVHLFDSPVPSRPTFGFDLDAFTEDFPENPSDESANVWMPQSNGGGIAETWTRFEVSKPNLAGFFGAVLNAMQNWQDNMQSRVPGFRDRIAHVNLSHDEGGLNLNMSPELLRKLAKRGFFAGELLIRNFGAPNPASCGDAGQPMNWDNHRLIRYRNAMALAEHWLRRFAKNYTPGYAALTDRPNGEPPCSYPWKGAKQRAFAQTSTQALLAMNEQWSAAGESFEDGAPRPQPELATRPRM